MSNLGQARTKYFNLGTAELRVGPQSLAGQLLPSHSVGVLQSAGVTVEMESVKLMAGFPQSEVASAIKLQSASVKASLSEASWRNLRILLGQGAPTVAPVLVTTTVSTAATAGALSLDVTSATGITAGQTIVIYPKGSPETVTVAVVESVATNVLTLSSETPLLHDYDPAKGPVEVFTSEPIFFGNLDKTNYMSCQLIQQDQVSGRPLVIDFWKVSATDTVSYDTSVDDYGTMDLTLTAMKPAVSEFAVDGELEHIANLASTGGVGRLVR